MTGPISVTTPGGAATTAANFIVTPPPSLSINDVRVREGNTGTRSAVFRVTLSAPSAQPVTVSYQTSDGTAAGGGNDYADRSGTLSFPPFVRSRAISVPIVGDTIHEGNETFLVTLSAPTGATIVRSQGKGTIVNDDP